MGYVTKDIAVITEPKIVSLSAAPNFVIFGSKASVKTLLEINVQVNINSTDTSIATKTIFNLTEPSGVVHSFSGSPNLTDVSDTIFYVSADRSDTAENLREALLGDSWINANLEIRIPALYGVGTAANGQVLNIKSKGTGLEYNAVIAAPNNTANVAYTITNVHAASINNDSISGESATAEIELDVYTGAIIRLGDDDRITSADKLGALAFTMQKTYAGVPLWFELNAVFNQYQGYNTPPAGYGWFDAGTAQVFRFTARKKAANSYTFYQSNALFAISGYAKPSEVTDLTQYTYKDMPVKLLTNKPRTTYVKGQREYLNFIFMDSLIGITAGDFSLKIVYRAFTTSDTFIGSIENHTIARTALTTVNTCALNIDSLLAAYPTTGIVRVTLARGAADVTNALEYLVRPQSLHDLCQFTFLNKLGGWDTFNFDTTVKYEPKANTETYNKTLTPAFKKGASLETVYTSALDDPRTAEGSPVTDDVANWLKELGGSRVIIDGDGNYVIKDDFSLPIAKSTSNMQTPILKYRLSETYTND